MTKSRRFLLGFEPIFEGGWLHKGRRAREWNAEGEIVALSILGDVTIDLAAAKTRPSEIRIRAYAIGRDVDIIVPTGTYVLLKGRADNDHLKNEVPADSLNRSDLTVIVTGHTCFGDVTTRLPVPIS